MVHIATLTLSPTIDGSSEAEMVQHTHKVRISKERFDPGGGGMTGSVLGGLPDRAGLRQHPDVERLAATVGVSG